MSKKEVKKKRVVQTILEEWNFPLMYARNGTRDVCFVYPRVFNFHFIINDDENAAANSFFSHLKFLFSAKFPKKNKQTKTKQENRNLFWFDHELNHGQTKAYHQMCLTWNAAASFYGHDERSFNNNNNKIGRLFSLCRH